MNSDNLYKDHTSLINDNAIKLIYRQMVVTLIFLLMLIAFVYALFTSNAYTILIFGVKFSLYYLPPFFLCLYFVVYSFYRIYFIVSGRLIKGIFINENIKLKIFDNKIIELNSFEIICDQKKIDYENRGEVGGKVFDKYDYKYIGIKSNGVIYLLPYKEEFKDITIKLLESVSH
ncbi:hypothetical protein [Psychrobacter celer]|uniref:hypothetical protein n=1 Tax=Psychrobacter celer TaxID=306572 RepID=UPI003FD6A046